MTKKIAVKKDDDYENDIEDIPDEDELEADFDEEEYEKDEEEEDEEKDEVGLEGEDNDTGCAIEDVIEDDNEYFDNLEEVELPSESQSEYVPKEKRVSANRLTKYEMVRILGERTKQLNMGAKPLIKNHHNLPYEKIAEYEFLNNVIPYKIKRPLPNGKFEIWTLDELDKSHLISFLE